MKRSDGPVRVGIVGCGFIGRFHSFMLHLAATRGELPVEKAFVYDLERSKAAEFEQWGWKAASSLDELLKGVDAVWVCVPTAYHLEVVEQAAAAGVSGIFCEKPLGRDLQEAEKVVEAAGDVPTQVGLVLRSVPPFRVAREIIASGELGKLQSVMFRDDQYVPIHGIYRSTWRRDRTVAGSGVLLEHSIHDVDLIDWIAGPIRWACGEVRSQIPVAEGIEDLAVATFGTADGSVSSLTTVWNEVKTRPSNRRVEIFGTRGILVIHDEVVGPVEIETSAGKEVLSGDELVKRLFEIEPPWYGETDPISFVANEDARFIRSLLEGTPPEPDFSVALRAHQIVDAVYTSSREGGTKVELEPGPR